MSKVANRYSNNTYLGLLFTEVYSYDESMPEENGLFHIDNDFVYEYNAAKYTPMRR